MIGRVMISVGLAVGLFVTLFVLPYATPNWQWNAFLVSIIVTLLFGDLRVAVIAGISGSLIFDLATVAPFGTHLIAIIFALASVRWISRTRLTNRSLAAYLALAAIGIVVFQVASFGAGWALQWIDPTAIASRLSMEWATALGVNLVTGLLFAVTIYLVARLSGRSYAKLSRYDF